MIRGEGQDFTGRRSGLSSLDVAINVGKAIGVAGMALVVANGLVYRGLAKEHNGRLNSPLDETQEVLATFDIDKDVDEGGFIFGLATAPAHVEDQLDDTWLEFAMETQPNRMKPEHKYPPYGSADEDEASATSVIGEVPDVTGRGMGADAADVNAEAQTEQSTTQASESLAESAVLVQPEDAQKSSLAESGVLVQPGEDSGEASGSNATGAVEGDWQVVGHGLKKTFSQSPEQGGKVPGSSQEGGRKEPPALRRQHSRRTTRDPQLSFTEDFNPIRTLQPVRKLFRTARDAVIGGLVEEQARRSREKERKKEQEEEEEEEEDDYDPNVAAFHNVPNPALRLQFWSDPEPELQLAQEAHQGVFRLGVDWGRLVPREPLQGTADAVDWAAVKRYRWILERVRAHGMEVMLSLFHHSMPKWAAAYGGWKDERTVTYFVDFSRLVAQELGDLVKWWITFNEPHVFAMLTYVAGAWPGGNNNLLETATSALPKGVFERAMAAMAAAHNLAYDVLQEEAQKTGQRARVGISHHVSWMRPYGLFDALTSAASTWMTRFAYVDDVCHKCDFIGINYYGQEFVSGPGLKLVASEEYSDSGRGVHPEGLFRALLLFHQRYNCEKGLNLPFYITENGVSDGTDYIRRPYLLEHLLAIRAAMDKGVPVRGYLHWTTSDNWEWADGYGPKFGLVHVDRANGLRRTKRPSFHLYAQVSKTGRVTRAQRDKAWESLQTAAREGKQRPFFRQVEANGLMYAGGLDVPINRPLVVRDWRFGHYQPDGLQDPLSKLARFILKILTFGQFGRTQPKQTKSNHGGPRARPDELRKPLQGGGPSVEAEKEHSWKLAAT